MDEEKEQQKEIREKLESEGIDPDELDEDEQPACAEQRFAVGFGGQGRTR